MGILDTLVSLLLSQVESLLVLGVASLSVMYAAILFERHPAVGYAATITLVSWDVGIAPLPGLAMMGATMYVGDFVAVTLVAAAALRLIRSGRWPRALGWPWWILLGALTVNLVAGVRAFGLQPALNEARGYGLFFAALLYGAIVTPRDWRRVWIVAGTGVAALAVVRFFLSGVGSAVDSSSRAVPAVLALVVAQAAVIALDRRTRGGAWLVGGLLIVAVLLQHRTVWVALAIGLAVLIAQQGSVRARRIAITLGGVTVALVAVFGLTGATSSTADNLRASVMEARGETSTFVWRVEGWHALLPDSPTTWALGRPTGSGYERQMVPGGAAVDVSPHNYYVTLLLQGGLVAVAALLLLYGRTWRSNHGLMRALMAMQLVYWVAYAGGVVQGLLLGLALASPLTGRAPGSVSPPRGDRTDRHSLSAMAATRIDTDGAHEPAGEPVHH